MQLKMLSTFNLFFFSIANDTRLSIIIWFIDSFLRLHSIPELVPIHSIKHKNSRAQQVQPNVLRHCVIIAVTLITFNYSTNGHPSDPLYTLQISGVESTSFNKSCKPTCVIVSSSQSKIKVPSHCMVAALQFASFHNARCWGRHRDKKEGSMPTESAKWAHTSRHR